MKKFLLLIIIVFSLTACTEDGNSNCPGCDDYIPTQPDPVITIPTKEYKLEFSGHGSPEQGVYLFTYLDGSQNMTSLFISADILKSQTLSAHNKIGFKLISTDGGQVLIDTVKITDVESNQVLLEEHNLQITFSKTFMYTIANDTYTIQ